MTVIENFYITKAAIVKLIGHKCNSLVAAYQEVICELIYTTAHIFR